MLFDLFWVIAALIAIQAREGIVTSREQAEAAYDKVQFDALSHHDGWDDPLKELTR